MITEHISLALGIARADATLRKRLEAPLGGAHGIGFTEFQILSELESVTGGRLRASDLAARLSLSPSGITRAALALDKIGLLERQPDRRDARGTFIALTARGTERIAQASVTADRVVGETLAAVLTRTDRLALLGLFERLNY